jgi:hypothetical protein
VSKNDPQALQAAAWETLACMNMDSTQQSSAQQMAEGVARQELTIGEQGTRVTLGVIKMLYDE